MSRDSHGEQTDLLASAFTHKWRITRENGFALKSCPSCGKQMPFAWISTKRDCYLTILVCVVYPGESSQPSFFFIFFLSNWCFVSLAQKATSIQSVSWLRKKNGFLKLKNMFDLVLNNGNTLKGVFFMEGGEITDLKQTLINKKKKIK